MKIDFQNTEIAFQNKSNFEIRRANLLFRTMAFPGLVKVFKKVVSFCLKLHIPINGIIKATVFKQFVGGETPDECHNQVENLYKAKVYSVLDYSAEGKKTEEAFDHTKETTISTIEFAGKNRHVPFAVFKPSGIGRFELYTKVSEGKELSPAEKEEWQRVRDRYYEISQKAFDYSVPVMVDAEETWIQKAIDDLVIELMMKFNKEKAIVWNTTQMYRKDRLEFLKKSIEHARKNNYFYGVKTVRGAYIEKERARAKRLGYDDPMQKTKPDTDRDFDGATQLLIENADICSVMVATHNANSVQVCADLMKANNMENDDNRVWIAQLFGMSDNISMNAAELGYNVIKYLPFAPVSDVMPYLFRRAEENTSVKGQTSRELELISTELKRRQNGKA